MQDMKNRFRIMLLERDGAGCIYRDIFEQKNYLLYPGDDGVGVEHPAGQQLPGFVKPHVLEYSDEECHFDTLEQLKAAITARAAKQVEEKMAARKSRDE